MAQPGNPQGADAESGAPEGDRTPIASPTNARVSRERLGKEQYDSNSDTVSLHLSLGLSKTSSAVSWAMTVER